MVRTRLIAVHPVSHLSQCLFPDLRLEWSDRALGGLTGALPTVGSLAGGLPGLGTLTGALPGGNSGGFTALP
jgi:hypothetical protein